MAFPTDTSASDVWSLKSLYVAVAGDNWPTLAYGDPNFNRVSLLLNGNGTDGGQNNTYTDSSSNGHTITPAGTIEQGSVSPFGDNWSNYFDGAASTNLYAGTGADLIPTTGDFTIEGWFYFSGVNTASQNRSAFFIKDSGFTGTSRTIQIHFENNGTAYNNIKITSFNGTNFDNVEVSVTIALGTWYHFAITRTGGTYEVFQDGVSQGSGTSAYSTLNSTTEQNYIGSWDSGKASTHIGYISNFRISHELVYTSDFTPSTEPLTATANTALLTCQANRFVDNSADDRTMTMSGIKVTSFSPFLTDTSITLAANGGSAYLNGPVNNAYLRTSGGATFSGDLTAECWVNCNYVDPTAAVIFDFRSGAANSNPSVFASSSGELGMYINSTSYLSGVNILNDGQWHHVALVRSSGVYTLYVDGVSTTTASIATSFTASRFQIGADDDGSPNAFYGGYISNLRIVNGTALYTSAFTPPTAPLTAISGTELLLSFADSAIFDYAALSNLGTIGNADISTSVFKYGTGSLAFDGTSDYLETPNKSELVLAGAPWTVECWVRPDGNYASYNAIFAKRLSGSTTTSYEGFLNITTGTVSFYNGTIYSSSTTLTSDVWSHCAWVYDGTNINIYVNGVSVLSTAVTISEVDTAFVIGGLRGYSEWFYGYMDDFRITKGLARYTSTFTPPTEALPTKGLPLPTITTVDYLIVAGGGGGGELFGGGGAGGLLSGTAELTPSTEYTITVGAGGAGAAAVSRAEGANGSDSSAFTLTAVGGGFGGTDQNGNAGGSGGAGGGWAGVAYTGGAGTAGQGFAGGTGGGGYDASGAAGGGASEVGGNASFRQAGNGGDGIEWPTGSGTYYAGGGGGTCWQGSTSGVGTNGVGGLGGGGDGGGSTTALNGVGESGTANTGGGGGAAVRNSSTAYAGGAGGSGVVILRTTSTASATTGSPTETTDGSYNVYTFTGSGSITF